MPVVHFEVVWPDGTTEACYSPSSVIKEHFSEGQSYPLKEFLHISETALNAASERVGARFGFACSSAMDQLSVIKTRCTGFENIPDAAVKMTRFID
ncbi:MSMEG_0570 family nitrogen starvation response protein [Marinomonas sp. 5E14-1]|uniref:MSMEG_0570 family nitrogen starvation response protein n=1 Tax=Marinomonas sp. 5E14-1 TaxID=3153922 RepID=UPI003267F67B